MDWNDELAAARHRSDQQADIARAQAAERAERARLAQDFDQTIRSMTQEFLAQLEPVPLHRQLGGAD